MLSQIDVATLYRVLVDVIQLLSQYRFAFNDLRMTPFFRNRSPEVVFRQSGMAVSNR